MRNLDVFIEIHGKEYYVGGIHGNNVMDASFKYDDEYFDYNYRSNSVLQYYRYKLRVWNTRFMSRCCQMY